MTLPVASYGAIEPRPAGLPTRSRHGKAALTAVALLALALATVAALAYSRPAAPGRSVLFWGHVVNHIKNFACDNFGTHCGQQRNADQEALNFKEEQEEKARQAEEAARAKAEADAAAAEAAREAAERAAEEARQAREAETLRKQQEAAAAAAARAAEAEARRQAVLAAQEASDLAINKYGTDVPPYDWAHHDSDWIYQGGPETDSVKHNVFYNQWEDLDDSPVGWHITEEVDPVTTDPWLSAVGNNIY